MRASFPMITIKSLFYCCKEMFTLMNIWMVGKISMKHYLKKKIFSDLNMEDITDADYTQIKRVCTDFEIKNLGEYHGLYVQSNTLLLADVSGNLRNLSLKIYELDPTHFLAALGLASQAASKKTEVRLNLLTDIYMLLYHSIY